MAIVLNPQYTRKDFADDSSIFRPICYPKADSAVAQLVERLAVNEDVLGSSPSRGAIKKALFS